MSNIILPAWVDGQLRELDDISDLGMEWFNAPCYSDYTVAGMPLHAVDKNGKSLCGLHPTKYNIRTGIREPQWFSDLFNTRKCKKCLKSLAKIIRLSERTKED